jgi:hypothetical protein
MKNQVVTELNEQTRKQKVLDKANFLIANNKVKRSQCAESHNIWMVSSYSTPKKWYVVRGNEDIDGFTCACKAFEYSSDNMCLHVAACSIFERGSA